MELQNGGEEIRQEKRRKKVEKWWRNDEEMQWRKVKWGRRKPRHKAIYSPPFFRVIYGANLARRFHRPYTACKPWPESFMGCTQPVNPGQKALWAVYNL